MTATSLVSSIRVNPGRSCSSLNLTSSVITPNNRVLLPVDTWKLKFLLNSEKYRKILETKLERFYASVEWSSGCVDKLELICTEKSRDGQNWLVDVENNVEQFLNTLETMTVKTDGNHLDEVRLLIESSDYIKSGDVLMTVSPTTNECLLVGDRANVKKAKDDLETIVKGGKRARSGRRITLKSYEISLCDSAFDKIRQLRSINLTVSKETNEIVISGNENQILEAMIILNDEICSIDQVSIENFHTETTRLMIGSKATEIICRNIQNSNVDAVWTLEQNNTFTVYSLSKQNAVKASIVIQSSVEETQFEVVGKECPNLPFSAWSDIFANIEHRFDGLVKVNYHQDKREIFLARIKGVTDCVPGEIWEILNGNLLNEVVDLYEPISFRLLNKCADELRKIIETSSCSVMKNSNLFALKISGTQNDIELVRRRVHAIFHRMIKKQHLCRTATLAYPSPDLFLKIEEKTGCVIRTRKIQEIRRIFTAIEGEVIIPDIDVVVIAVDRYLKPVNESSKLILQKAGKRITKDCEKFVQENGPLTVGDVYLSSGGNLNCCNVIHAVLPVSENGLENTETLLQTILHRCQTEMDRAKFRSVAFPDDFLKPESISRIFLKVLSECLKTPIEIVFWGNDNCICNLKRSLMKSSWDVCAIFEYFSKEALCRPSIFVPGHGWYDTSPIIDVKGFTQHIGNKKILVYEGDITSTEVDAIVNSTNKHLDLTKGFVSQNLLFKAGQELLKEVQSEQNKKDISRTGLAVTSPGDPSKIPCCFIFHANLRFSVSKPHHRKALKKVILKILKKAEAMKLSSIAFPALGTGLHSMNLGDTVRCMCEAITEFNKQHMDYVNEIHLVILNGDDLPILHSSFKRYFMAQSLPWVSATQICPFLPVVVYGSSQSEVHSAIDLLDHCASFPT